MAENLITLAAVAGVILYVVAAVFQTKRAQEDERIPISRPIGLGIAAILGIAFVRLFALDAIGDLKWPNMGMGWLEEIVPAMLKESLGIGG